MKRYYAIFIAVCVLAAPACKARVAWQPGKPMPREQLKIGVIYVSNPDTETSGWSFSHALGIREMQKAIGLDDDSIMYKINLNDVDKGAVESTIRNFIANGANLIIATSFGYMDVCEKLAKEFPGVVFTYSSGHKMNDTNLTSYYGKIYQARYLAGLIAGIQTKSGKIGYVAAMGKDSSDVSRGLNAFAIGVERVNPRARVHIKITHSWFDPMGEANAARALIASGCDVIAQHCDTPNPQIEAEKAGVWGIGYCSDMSVEAPHAVLTSVIWKWGAYYTALAENIISGDFVPEPYFGSLGDGIVDITPLNSNIAHHETIVLAIQKERQRILSGDFDVFDGILETNTGEHVGNANGRLSDEEIRDGIHWYYRNITEI